MDWPNELELDLDSMAQGGDAVGRYEGRTVFASGGLPGERARVRLHDRQKAFARGHVIEILDPAAERVPSFCPLERACGAADWRSVDYRAQLRFKAEILRDQLRHLGAIEVEVLQPNADQPQRGYRTTAELHIDGATIGYYLPGTRRVADVPACCLHHPLINDAIAALRPLLSSDRVLRGVTVRCSPSTETVLALLDGGKTRSKRPLRDLARRWRTAFPALVGVTDERGRALDGSDILEQRVGDLRFRVSATSFFQINGYQWEPLVDRVARLLDAQPQDRVLDVYCGVGLFALTLARRAREVVGVEEWAGAIGDARRNAKLNAISNARFEVGAAERALGSLDGGFARVVLDPPRRGCDPAALDALAKAQPARIVYVSCHPGTLARDCKLLAAAGYRVAGAEVIDMFPHTHHVESIVQLERS